MRSSCIALLASNAHLAHALSFLSSLVADGRILENIQFILRRLSEVTNGDYSIAGDENHYRESLMAQCTPPPTQPGQEGANKFADLVRMGFPAETQVRRRWRRCTSCARRSVVGF